MDYKTAMMGSSSQTSNSDTISSNTGRISQPPLTTPISETPPPPQITIHKLSGSNYLEWAQSIRLVIDGKGKLGYLIGETKSPAIDDPKYSQWRSENSMVTVWLINSSKLTVGKPFLFMPTGSDVWGP